MPAITVDVRGPALKAFAKGKQHRALTRATRKASGTSARDMRSEAVKVVRAAKRLKVRAIRKDIVTKKNKARNLDAMGWGILVKGGIKFVHDYPFRQTKRGIVVEIRRGRKTLIEGAFKARVKAGESKTKAVAFQRLTSASLPVKTLPAPRALDVLNDKRAAKRIHKRGLKSYRRAFKALLPMEEAKLKK